LVDHFWKKIKKMKMILFLLGFCFLFHGVVCSTAPTPPQAYVDTTYSLPTGPTITVNSGGDLQAALNSATLGSTIVLEAGASFVGSFNLPTKTGTGWIYIQSSAINNLPAYGTRVSPSDSANMPKIIATASTSAITASDGAHHFRFVGIEFTTTSYVTNIILFGDTSTTVGQLPHHMIFDRCYFHGDLVHGTRRAMYLNTGECGIVCSFFKSFGENGADSQAIGASGGTGPYRIWNNYLEANSENVLFGGSDPAITNLVPSDIEITNNYFDKNLTYLGPPKINGWVIKNILEFKNAQRVIVDGNVFYHNWADAQSGFSIVFTPRNQDGNCPWCVVQDIAFTNNILAHVGCGFNILGSDDLHPSQTTARILIENNLVYDVDGTTYLTNGKLVQITTPTAHPAAQDIVFNHNTILHTLPGNSFLAVGDTDPVCNNCQFTNSIVTYALYGLFGSGIGQGNVAIAQYLPNFVFANNVIIGGGTAGTYPATNFFPAALTDVGFVDYLNDNYTLTSSSPYHNGGTDGKDIGVDMAQLDAHVAGAVPIGNTGTSAESSVNAAQLLHFNIFFLIVALVVSIMEKLF